MGLPNVRARLALVLTVTVVTTVAATVAAVVPTAGIAGAAATASVFCEAAPPGGAVPDRRLESYEGITPQRLVDTREGTGGVSTPVGEACTLRLDLDGSDVPSTASAVSLSVTGISSQAGFLTVYPCAAGLPATSNVNPRAGFPTPNLVVATPDANREICIFTLFASDILVDLAGWWDAGPDRFRSVAPARAIDTRETAPSQVPPLTETVVAITGGTPGAGVPVGATAASVNLTVTDTGGDGFLVAYPCGTDVPLASNLNFRRGETRAVAAIVGLDADGNLCVQSNVAHEVIVDVNGYYAPAPQFGPTAALHPLAGVRIASSRDGSGGWTGRFAAGVPRSIDPVAAVPMGPEATAVTVNITALNADAPGFATAYPCGGAVPEVSSVNVAPGAVVANLVTVDLARDRTLCFYASTPLDLIVDLFGVMAAPSGSLAERMTFDGHTWPPFSPAATDYGVECGADGEAAIDIEPVASVTTRVNGLVVSPGTDTLGAEVDELVTVDLRRGSDRTVYQFRCLPIDFPRLDVVRTGPTAPGWYLTTLWGPSPNPPGLASFSVILDGNGAPIWYKRTERVVGDMKLRSDGRLIYVPQLGTAYGIEPDRGYRITSLSGTLLDEHLTVDPVTNPVDHHDYVELPGGAYALIAYPLVKGVNMTAIPGGGYFADEWMVDGVVQEVGANGSLLWDWRVDDHFGYNEITYPQRFTQYPGAPHGGEADPWHINSLYRVDDVSGDYIVSMRHLDAIVRVDHATENVDWIFGSIPSLGQPGYIANEQGAPRLRIVGDPLGGPRRPHDARLVGDVLTLFDNRTATGQPARAVAYRINAGAGTATLLWQINSPTGTSSGGLGSVQVNPDGSVLVDWGAGVQPMFQELTGSGTPLLSMTQAGGATYRIVKVPFEKFTAATLRANAGGNAEVPG